MAFGYCQHSTFKDICLEMRKIMGKSEDCDKNQPIFVSLFIYFEDVTESFEIGTDLLCRDQTWISLLFFQGLVESWDFFFRSLGVFF